VLQLKKGGHLGSPFFVRKYRKLADAAELIATWNQQSITPPFA
jgi:hypothetical protein